MTFFSPSKLLDLGDPRRIAPDRSSHAVEVARLAPGTGLTVALLLSLAFWGAAWLGVSSLAAEWWVR